MSKKTNTELKFTDHLTTGGTSSSITYPTVCKYYLPCGKCDKTNEICTYHHATPTYPVYPWWEGPYYDWSKEITCMDASNCYTYTYHSDTNSIFKTGEATTSSTNTGINKPIKYNISTGHIMETEDGE